MNPHHRGKKTLVDLFLAFGIAVALFLLNLVINFGDAIHGFFAVHARMQISLVLVNFLFLWLAVLLVLAFFRWREATRQQVELEDVISSISPDALLVVNPGRTIVMCTSAVRRLFGYEESEVLHKKTDMLYHDRRKNRQHPHEIYEALEKDGFHVGTATGRRKDGSTMPLEIIAGDLRNRGGVVLLLRDMTERQRMDEHRRRLEERALRVDKLESLGVLAGGAAHDFNNLLMVIQGYADLTNMNPEPPAAVCENMAEIQKASHRAMELCERLMSFTGDDEKVLKPVNFSDLIRDAGRLFDVSVGDRIRVEYELDGDVPLVRCDASQIHQIFMNLMVNAKDAMGLGDGQIKVRVGLRSCDEEYLSDTRIPSESKPGEFVYLEVADNGCGMDEATSARICDPFFSTKVEGHGLGLAAVLGLVRGHGGTLKVTSVPGQGSTFTILLPRPDAA